MFNEGQLEQIELGIQQGLDVSVYAKECFDWMQMWEIRLGLKYGLDVSIYAKPEISRDEMHKIMVSLTPIK